MKNIYTNYFGVLVYCLGLTLFIELLLAFILGLRKKDLVNVVLVNFLTNPLLNSIHPLFLFKYGKSIQILVFIILEVLVVFIEGFIYKKTLKYEKMNKFLLSFILNLSSLSIGLLLNSILF